MRVLLSTVLLLAGLQLAAGPATGQLTDALPTRLLYVCVQDDAAIAIVDMDALEVVEVVRLIDLGFSAQAAPHDVAVSEDGRHWYVSLIGEQKVLQFDAENQLVGALEIETPGMIGLDPSGETLVISRSMSAANPPRLVGIAHTRGMRLDELDVVFPRPHAVAIGRDGRFAYTAGLGTNQLASIDLASERAELTEVPGPAHAFVQLAISPDGTTLVASGELSGELIVFSLEDPVHPAIVTSLNLGSRPFDPVFSADGGSVWVPIKGEDAVTIVDTTDWTVSERIVGAGIRQPHAIEFSPDGRRAFVTNNAAGSMAHLVVIDTATRQVERALDLGRNLTGMGHRSR